MSQTRRSTETIQFAGIWVGRCGWSRRFLAVFGGMEPSATEHPVLASRGRSLGVRRPVAAFYAGDLSPVNTRGYRFYWWHCTAKHGPWVIRRAAKRVKGSVRVFTLHPVRTHGPRAGKVTNEFYLTGQLKKTTGVRTYPVEYTYDYAGRMVTMKTWTNYPSGTPAVTTWAYHANRGWLAGKFYADAATGAAQSSSGTTYTYTDVHPSAPHKCGTPNPFTAPARGKTSAALR